MSGGGVPRRELARQALEVVTGRWVMDVVEQLGVRSPMRYGELVDAIPKIPEGSLSRTLRHMERDGLVRRIVRPTMPVQVDYALTPLGASASELVEMLAGWATEHGVDVETARAAHPGPQV